MKPTYRVEINVAPDKKPKEWIMMSGTSSSSWEQANEYLLEAEHAGEEARIACECHGRWWGPQADEHLG